MKVRYSKLDRGAVLNTLSLDILFPFIPRTSSSAIDERLRLTRTSSLPIETTFLDPKEQPRHDHALLESLFFGVFERRFINTRPTKIIPQCRLYSKSTNTETQIYIDLNYRFRQVMCESTALAGLHPFNGGTRWPLPQFPHAATSSVEVETVTTR